MIPDFNKSTIDTIAKRSGFICSNPDCRAKTVGPNLEVTKSIVIGEAAHIYGARQNSKRYDSNMTDLSRAEITNAIWLCRNCHKLIDSDENYYTSEILFRWRELHEEYVLSELGNKTALIQNEQFQYVLEQFNHYPPIIRRIVTDKPKHWEYRLTAELMRFLNKPLFRKLRDLHGNLYLKTQSHVEDEEVFNWIQLRLKEALNLIEPIAKLMDELNKSWGESGQAGEVNDIHHTCILIRNYIDQVINYEELLRFTYVSEKVEGLKQPLHDLISTQIMKIEKIPQKLEENISLISSGTDSANQKPLVISEALTFKLPENWVSDFNYTLRKIR